MNPILRHRLVPGVAVVLLAAPGPVPAAKPGWLVQRPVVTGSAIGIGSADIAAAGGTGKAHSQAFAAALGDIAGQVSVQVTAASDLQIREDGAGLEQDYGARLAATSAASLTGVEIVDTWTDGERVWVYARFDLVARERAAAARRQGLQDLAARLLDGPGGSAVLAASVRALAQQPTTAAGPEGTALLAALRQRLQALDIADLTVTVTGGVDGGAWLRVQLADRRGGAPAGVPVRVNEPGQGHTTAWTDAEGVAVVRLAPVAAARVVGVEVDPDAWLDPGVAAGAAWLRALPRPQSRLELQPVRRAAHLALTVDAEAPVPGLEDLVAALLTGHGLDLTQAAGVDSVLQLEVRIHARRGVVVAGIHFAFVDVDLVVEHDGRREAIAAPRIKGAGSSFAEAVRAALHNPCARLGAAAVSGRQIRVRRTPRRRSRVTPTSRAAGAAGVPITSATRRS